MDGCELVWKWLQWDWIGGEFGWSLNLSLSLFTSDFHRSWWAEKEEVIVRGRDMMMILISDTRGSQEENICFDVCSGMTGNLRRVVAKRKFAIHVSDGLGFLIQ